MYLGHPTTVLLEDNRTMLVVYPKGHGRGAVVMKRSVDAGLTWSERLPVPGNWCTSQEVPTIYRTVSPDGTFVVTTYGHWVPGEQPYILSVRFTLGEVDEMAA